MPSKDCPATGSNANISLLFVHAADEELKNLVLPCLQGFQEISTAEYGSEALLLCQAKQPCIVVTALELGDMNGFELATRIHTASAETRILLVGREQGESVYKRALQAGVASYVDMNAQAAESLKSIVSREYAACEAKIAQQQKFAANRLQADALQHLQLPVALISDTGKLVSANHAFWDVLNIGKSTGCMPLSEVLSTVTAIEPGTGWDRLLEAAERGLEWAGDILCKGSNGARIYFRASLHRITAEQSESPQIQLLTLDDVSSHEIQRSLLAVQRDSAFEIIESFLSVQTCPETMAPTFSGTSKIQKLIPPEESLHVAKQLHECIAMKSLVELLVTEPLPAPLPFSLRTLITSVISSVSKNSGAQGKVVRCTIPQYLPDLFLGHQGAISRILLCLLGNALENGDGYEIHLKVDLKERTASGICIQFTVAFLFNGSGANFIESMQEYLTGLHVADRNQRPRKTGLNLAATLIEKMEGTAWVRNMVNRGCTYCFSLTLPESSTADAAVFNDAALREPVTEQKSGAGFELGNLPDKKALERPRILLADDNEVDQLRICRLLESMNYDVIRVSNGREAVEEFDVSSVDAILMDILMPEMDGFEATRMIREKERLVAGSHTTIIALTSYSLKAIHEKCVSVGMDGYLHKPVSAVDIATLFNSIFSADTAPEIIQDELQSNQLPLLDITETLDNMSNNVDLYREIIGLFTANILSDQQMLMEAFRTGSLSDVHKNAHKIKGMSASIGAKRHAELADQIEEAALNGAPEGLEKMLQTLSEELPRLLIAIAAINWDDHC